MSVRAYRVNTMQTEGNPTFNLWHDENLVAFFEDHGSLLYQLNVDANGVAVLPVKALEEAVKRADELRLPEYVVKALKEDIAFARQRGSQSVSYECW